MECDRWDMPVGIYVNMPAIPTGEGSCGDRGGLFEQGSKRQEMVENSARYRIKWLKVKQKIFSTDKRFFFGLSTTSLPPPLPSCTPLSVRTNKKKCSRF